MSYNIAELDSDIYTYEYFLQLDVCRLCWNREAIHDIILSNTLENGENTTILRNQLLNKIRDCLNLEFSSVSLPNKLCSNCYTLIEKYHNFRIFCHESDRRLKDIANQSNYKTVDLNLSCVKVENDDIKNLEHSESYYNSVLNHDFDYTSDHTIVQVKKSHGSSKKSSYILKRTPTYCNICQIDLETEEKFTVHNSKSHGIENGGLYRCFGCAKLFRSAKARLGHEIKYCKELIDGYKCTICSRFLPKRRLYESHIRKHRNNEVTELPADLFKCLKCSEVFETKRALKIHIVSHDEIKNFVCESCGRVFTRVDYLTKHKLTHTGEKQYECTICGYKATQKSSLNVHMRKHTGDRPYSCDMCPQRCVSSSNLRAHQMRHLGVKKYECSICAKKFGYKISLEEHITSIHEHSGGHTCQLCGSSYSRKRGLRRHLHSKHGTKTSKCKDGLDEDEKGVDFQKTTEKYVMKSSDDMGAKLL